MLEEFLGKGAIERAWRRPLFLSKVKTVPKSNGKLRLILDLSRINLYLKKISFKMPSIREMRLSIPSGSWIGKVDLLYAYLHVPVAKHFRRYLASMWGWKAFQFSAVPIGLSLAPAIFTGIMNHPLKVVRGKRVHAVVYLDDWLVWATSFEACRRALEVVLHTMKSLGFLINGEKAQLRPSQRLVWLGAEWDSEPSEVGNLGGLQTCLGVHGQRYSVVRYQQK